MTSLDINVLASACQPMIVQLSTAGHAGPTERNYRKYAGIRILWLWLVANVRKHLVGMCLIIH